MFRKVKKKYSTASDRNFLGSVKKCLGGQIAPPPGRNMVKILIHFEEFNLNPERGITGISSLSCEKNVRNTLIVSFKNVI